MACRQLTFAAGRGSWGRPLAPTSPGQTPDHGPVPDTWGFRGVAPRVSTAGLGEADRRSANSIRRPGEADRRSASSVGRLGGPAHPDAEAVTGPRYLDVVRQPRDDSQPEFARQGGGQPLAVGPWVADRRPFHSVVVRGGIGHDDLEPLFGAGQSDPDRLGRAVLLVYLDGTGTCLAHGEADLVK